MKEVLKDGMIAVAFVVIIFSAWAINDHYFPLNHSETRAEKFEKNFWKGVNATNPVANTPIRELFDSPSCGDGQCRLRK